MRFSPARQVSKVTTRSSPVRGINAYDAIISAPEGFALIMRNLFAQPYGVQVRHGYVRHCEGLDGDVETVMSHNTLTPKLYAFSAGDPDAILYDVTTPNAVTCLQDRRPLQRPLAAHQLPERGWCEPHGGERRG